MDSKQYLQADFDANTLKVAQLRGILNEHDIKFASNSKKKQLVSIFNKELRPRAEEILKQHHKSVENLNDEGFVDVKRGGDEDLGSEEIDEEDDEEVDENDEETVTKDPKTDDEAYKRVEPENDTASKRKIESSMNNSKSTSQNKSPRSKAKRSASPFTSENVFQSPNNSMDREKRKRTQEEEEEEKRPKKKRNVPRESAKSDRSIFDSSSDSEEKEHTSVNPKGSFLSPRTNKTSTPLSMKRQTGKIIHQSSPLKSHDTSSQENKSRSRIVTPKKPIDEPNDKSGQSEEDELFHSLKDEEQHFNQQLNKIKKGDQKAPVPNSQALASQLGITIQGVPKKGFELKDSSFNSTMEPKTSGKKTLVPRPRSIPSSKVSDRKKEAAEADKDNDTAHYKNTNKDSTIEDQESSTSATLTNSYMRIKGKVGDDLSRLNSMVKERYSFKSLIFFLVVWIILVSGGLISFWYREQMILVGFCGQEVNRSTIPDDGNTVKWLVKFGNYMDSNFKPACVPCPPHARCFPHLELGCFEDFCEWEPWYAIFNPTLKRCVPDTKKAEKLEIMIEVALDLLRTKNANKSCGTALQTDTNVGISVADLHDMLLSMKAPYITIEEFEELWNRSLVELEKEPEIITGYTDADLLRSAPNLNHSAPQEKNKILRSTSLSHISFKCKLQNSLIRTIVRFKYHIATVVLAGVLIQLVRARYRSVQLENARIEIICKEVIKKLVKQKCHARSSDSVPPYIGSNQLRDLILSSEHNLQKRSRTWEKISSKIENNSNVRSSLNENHGEIMKVWEWISDLVLD